MDFDDCMYVMVALGWVCGGTKAIDDNGEDRTTNSDLILKDTVV